MCSTKSFKYFLNFTNYFLFSLLQNVELRLMELKLQFVIPTFMLDFLHSNQKILPAFLKIGKIWIVLGTFHTIQYPQSINCFIGNLVAEDGKFIFKLWKRVFFYRLIVQFLEIELQNIVQFISSIKCFIYYILLIPAIFQWKYLIST